MKRPTRSPSTTITQSERSQSALGIVVGMRRVLRSQDEFLRLLHLGRQVVEEEAFGIVLGSQLPEEGFVLGFGRPHGQDRIHRFTILP